MANDDAVVPAHESRVLVHAKDAGLRGSLERALRAAPPAPAFHPLGCTRVPESRPFRVDLASFSSAVDAADAAYAALGGGRPFAVAFLDGGAGGDASLPARLRAADPRLELVLVGAGAPAGPETLRARAAPASKLTFLPAGFRDHEAAQLARVLAAKWRADRQLRASEARLATCQRLGGIGIWEWNVRSGEARWSRELARLLELREGSEGGPVDLVWERVHPADRARVRGEMGRAAHESGSRSLEYRIMAPRSGIRHVRQESVPSVGAGEGDRWTVCAVQDVTDRLGVDASIRSLVWLDPLTRLPNRSFVREYLHKTLLLARRHGRTAALLHVDLDGFKRVNDTLGHAAGDRVLREVASRLEGCVRESDCVARDAAGPAGVVGDTVARFGADEFLIILSEVSEALDPGRVAERVLERLAAPVDAGGRQVTVSASIGVAAFPEHADDEDRLLRNAALAMQSAKHRGRNTWQTFDPLLEPPRHVDRLNLETALRQALERDGLAIHYQPKVRARDLQLAGAEALLRWHHPTLGHVPPSTFVPIAEESGLIVPLGEWVVRSVCEQMAAWRRAGHRDVPVSINVSAQQLRDHALVDQVRRMLDETGLEPRELDFEITESVLMEETGGDRDPLRELRAMGATVSMDDFGTGYSSLSYLKRLPVDVVKIDRSFVRDILREADDQAILRAVITMVHELRMHVVAEGVESKEQLALLTAMGVDQIQGYVISRPLPQAVFAERFLAEARLAAG